MIKKEIIVRQDLINAREIAQLVQIAMQYQSSLYITYQSYHVNTKSIMGMMYLGLRAGMKITISGEGDDENTAVDRLERYLS